MQKGYTDGGPWHGNQVRAGPVLIRSYSESGHDVVIQVVHVCIRVGAEWRQSGSGQGRTEAECGRGLPRGVDKGVTRGKRARGRSYHDIVNELMALLKPEGGLCGNPAHFAATQMEEYSMAALATRLSDQSPRLWSLVMGLLNIHGDQHRRVVKKSQKDKPAELAETPRKVQEPGEGGSVMAISGSQDRVELNIALYRIVSTETDHIIEPTNSAPLS